MTDGSVTKEVDQLTLTLTRLTIEQAALRADNRKMREDLDELQHRIGVVEDSQSVTQTTLEDLETAVGRVEDRLEPEKTT